MTTILVQITQNAGVLSLAGLALFWFFLRIPEDRHSTTRSALVGLALGLAAATVTSIPIALPDGSVVDGRAGPLVFAGFLGGPIAALAAALLGGTVRYLHGGPFVLAGVYVFLAYALVGCLLGCARKRRGMAARSIPISFVAALIAASWIALVSCYWFISPSELANAWLWNGMIYTAVANALSIAVVAATQRMVFATLEGNRRMQLMQRRLELATSAAGIGIWEYDVKQDRFAWNDQQFRLYGLEPQASPLDWEKWLGMIHPDEQADVAEAARVAIAGGSPIDTEFRIVTANNDIRPLKAKAVAMRDGSGETTQLLGVNFDVSQIRHYEAELRARQLQLEKLAEAIPGAIFIYLVDVKGSATLRYMSPGALQLWEMAPDAIGTNSEPLWGMIDPEHGQRVRDSMASAAASHENWVEEWPITTPSGRRKWLQCHASSRRVEDGATEFYGMVLDITEQAQVRTALEQSNQLLAESRKLEAVGKLSGGIAHDFNNLMAVIMGNLELIEPHVTGENHEMIADALRACTRGATLTQQLLSFGRKAMLDPKPLDPTEVLTSVERLLRRTLPTTIRIEMIHGGGVAQVRLDRGSLENALLNLALNARDAMPEGGRLTLETANVTLGPDASFELDDDTPPGDYVMIAVSDEGTGMAPCVAAKAYDPFFTTKPVGAGSGMGLSMVHGFVKQSSGAIQITSERGAGTTVRMYFPVASPDEQGASAVDTPPAQPVVDRPDSGHILLVEDNEEVRRAISRQIIRLGYQVTEAADGVAGLKAIEVDPSVDLLVTDVVMPGPLQGPDLAIRIRKIRPDVPVVFMSGYSQLNSGTDQLIREQDDQILKPVQFRDLANLLREKLG